MLPAQIHRLKQRLMPVLGPIILRFSRSSCRWTDGKAQPVGALAGLPSGACVLPREKVLFTRLNLADIPPRQREEALKLELEQKAPFDDPAGWVVWEGGQACVWYWPGTLQSSIESQLNLKPNTADFIPEPVLWPQLKKEQYRWVSCGESGLELVQFRHPRHGLYEKRYPDRISPSEADAWLNRHGANTHEVLAPVGRPGYTSPSGASLQRKGSALEGRILPASALLLSFFIVAYAVAIARASFEVDSARQQARAAEAGVADVLSVRSHAAELQTSNAMLASYQVPSQLSVAAELAEVLDVQGGRLLRWGYRAGQLELSWQPEGALPDTTEVIATLEERPRFSAVQAQARGDSMIELSLTIENLQAGVSGVSDD